MSNHARAGRQKKRKPVDRYDAAELHALCVDDVLAGVHTRPDGSAALGWFGMACARIGRLRGVSTDVAFLDVMHDAEQKQGRPLL